MLLRTPRFTVLIVVAFAPVILGLHIQKQSDCPFSSGLCYDTSGNCYSATFNHTSQSYRCQGYSNCTLVHYVREGDNLDAIVRANAATFFSCPPCGPSGACTCPTSEQMDDKILQISTWNSIQDNMITPGELLCLNGPMPAKPANSNPDSNPDNDGSSSDSAEWGKIGGNEIAMIVIFPLIFLALVVFLCWFMRDPQRNAEAPPTLRIKPVRQSTTAVAAVATGTEMARPKKKRASSAKSQASQRSRAGSAAEPRKSRKSGNVPSVQARVATNASTVAQQPPSIHAPSIQSSMPMVSYNPQQMYPNQHAPSVHGVQQRPPSVASGSVYAQSVNAQNVYPQNVYPPSVYSQSVYSESVYSQPMDPRFQRPNV